MKERKKQNGERRKMPKRKEGKEQKKEEDYV